MNWIAETLGEGPTRIAAWIAIVLALALLAMIVLRSFRGLVPGLFIAGGGKRHHRLAVIDATAVDSRRCLVLVRRDDREHLLLIGGPADLVVESDIATTSPAQEPAAAAPEAAEPVTRAQPRPAQPEQVRAERPRAEPPAREQVREPARPVPTPEAVAEAVTQARAVEPPVEREPAPQAARAQPDRSPPPQVRPPAANPAIAVVPPPAAAPREAPAKPEEKSDPDFSDALRAVFGENDTDEYTAHVPAPRLAAAAGAVDNDDSPSLEEEMKRLLDQLSSEKSGT